jgi:hypothetical protein
MARWYVFMAAGSIHDPSKTARGAAEKLGHMAFESDVREQIPTA